MMLILLFKFSVDQAHIPCNGRKLAPGAVG